MTRRKFLDNYATMYGEVGFHDTLPRVIGASFDMPANNSFRIVEICKVLAHIEPYCPTICLSSISF
jgi:hypothetical protein